MGSPQDAALRHRVNSIRAVIQSFEADLGVASLFGRADIELLISFFNDVEKTAKNEIELHELMHGGIEARKRACANPERFITNAPAPPIDIFNRTPPHPRRSREEQIASKKAGLESDLKKAEARSSELQKVISDWYLCAFPEWNAVTANARARWNSSQRLAIEQYSALKFNSEHLPDLQGRGKVPEGQKAIVPPARSTSANYGYGSGSDRLATLSVGGVVTQAIGYTADGRIASLNPGIQAPGGQYITSLSYNQDARLSAVNASGGALASYTYDGFGQRLTKTVSASYGEIYQYGQDGMLLEETNASGVAQADYIYLNDRPVAL